MRRWHPQKASASRRAQTRPGRRRSIRAGEKRDRHFEHNGRGKRNRFQRDGLGISREASTVAAGFRPLGERAHVRHDRLSDLGKLLEVEVGTRHDLRTRRKNAGV